MRCAPGRTSSPESTPSPFQSWFENARVESLPLVALDDRSLFLSMPLKRMGSCRFCPRPRPWRRCDRGERGDGQNSECDDDTLMKPPMSYVDEIRVCVIARANRCTDSTPIGWGGFRPWRGDNVPVKRLLVLRHAKSDWADSSLDDWQRPLSCRGINDAPRVGEILRERASIPDLIITSDAIRARSTAEAVAEAAATPAHSARAVPLHATPDAIVEVLNSWEDDSAGAVMIVGHNPGLEGLIAQLSGDTSDADRGTGAARPADRAVAGPRPSLSATLVDSWRPGDA